MQAKKISAMFGLAGLFVLASCDTVSLPTSQSLSGRGFEKSYFMARSALEEGNYGTAIRRFNALLGSAGPLETRMRLELAHAYLRADDYAEASKHARIVATSHQDARRSAALAVYATAEHRLAQEAMSDGDFGPQTRAHLEASDRAFAEMLRAAPELDPLSGLAERHKMVKASLKQLGR